MRRILLCLLLLACPCLLLLACPPLPTPVPIVDSGPVGDSLGDPADRACAALARLGCTSDAHCADALRRAVDAALVPTLGDNAIRCLSVAQTPGEARSCSPAVVCAP
jgi:hypothetical protein